MQPYFGHQTGQLFLFFLASVLAQIPNDLIELANKNSDKSGAWWATAVAFGALALLVFIGRYGIKAIKAIVADHKELQKQHVETLKETLTATQKIAGETQRIAGQNADLVERYDEILQKTNQLIEADIRATNENARALQDLETLIDERFK